MCLWVYTGSISRWVVWDIRRMWTPKHECLQLKTLVKTLLKTFIFPEDFENEEDGATLKIWMRTMKREDFCFFIVSFLSLSHRKHRTVKGGRGKTKDKFPSDAQLKSLNITQSFEWSLWKPLTVQSSSSATETMFFWSLRKLVWLRS